MFPISERLAANCGAIPERRAWLAQLPDAVRELQQKWELSIEAPFDGDDVSCAWVAPAARRNGARVILKLGMPHLEGRDEIHGLRFWQGNPTVLLLEADEALNAMLLERCEPGTALRCLAEPRQDVVIAGLLHRLWRTPPAPHAFRPLSEMTAQWAHATIRDAHRWPDAGLVREGLGLFEELSRSSEGDVLLATDLHAGNVLEAQREPWLVIDPKPFVGDRAYDATQHLFNCRERMRADPHATIHRFADLLEVDADRARLWMFARLAAEPRDIWDAGSMMLARNLN